MGRVLAVAFAALVLARSGRRRRNQKLLGRCGRGYRARSRQSSPPRPSSTCFRWLVSEGCPHHVAMDGPGLREPVPGEQNAIKRHRRERRRSLTGTRMFRRCVSSRTAARHRSRTVRATSSPHTQPRSRARTPTVRDFVIFGNEPNLNRFWLPQFNPDGSDAAAPAYLALLARSYDALKLVDPGVRVWGGALAPRGIDRPGTGRTRTRPWRS